MVKIRLRRMGMKRTPHYRVVVINSREELEAYYEALDDKKN